MLRVQRALVLGLAGLAFAAGAQAASSVVTGGGPSAGRMNLRVVVPWQLYFAVGPGATGPRVPNAAITTVTYDYTGVGDTLGNGTPTGYVNVPVRIYCNAGPTSITVSHPPNLVNGTDTIPFTQIQVISLDPTNFPAPVMGGGPVFPLANGASKITNRSTTWRYRYLNTVKPGGGMYNGQVTYTAALL